MHRITLQWEEPYVSLLSNVYMNICVGILSRFYENVEILSSEICVRVFSAHDKAD